MAKTYEYLIEEMSPAAAEDRLNELGAEGWALSSYMSVGGATYRAVLMREAYDDEEPPDGPSPLPPDQAPPAGTVWGWIVVPKP